MTRLHRLHLLAAAIVALGVMAATTAVAQPPGADAEDGDGPEAHAALPVKIDDLIEVAVRLAPDLARAKIDRKVARDAAAGERRGQAWIVSSSVNYTRDAQADHVDVPLFSVVGQDTIAGMVGIGRNLPSGGSVQADLEVQRQVQELNIPSGVQNTLQGQSAQSAMPIPTYDQVQNNTTALRLTFKQPLARGFGPKVALAPEKKADLAASEETIKAQLAAETMVRDIVTGYWELAYASYEVDVRQQAVDLARRQEQLTHQQMRAGTVAANAAAEVTYELSTRQEALLRAKLTLEQKSLELREKVGLPLDKRDIVLRPEQPLEIGDEDFDLDRVLERSRQTNRQLATVALERKIAGVDLAVASDQTRPQVDLSLSGALVGIGADAGTSLSSLGAGDSYEVTAGLSVSFELSGAARKARDAAREKVHRLEVDRADLERQIETQVVTAVHGVSAARARVALSDKAIDVAEQTARAERNMFMVGRATNYQVMQRQTDLIEARLARGRAAADYREAVAQLEFLSGTLLHTYRVDVRPHAKEGE